MTPYLAFAGLIYTLYYAASYSQEVRDSSWYVPAGLCMALVANLSWLLLTRHLASGPKIVLAAIWWDVMVVGVSLLVPTVFFKIQLSPPQWLGIFLIAIGVILTHLKGAA